MKRFLSADAPLIQALGVLADVMIVNVLFLLCCVPVVTLGAARAALYGSAIRWVKKEDAGAVFFLRNFVQNLKQGIPAGLGMLALGAFLVFDAYLLFVHPFQGAVVFLFVLVVLAVVYSLVLSQLFLIQAKFVCSFGQLFRNALLVALGNPLRSAAILAVDAVPWLVLAFYPEQFLQLGVVWLLFYGSVGAYFAAKIMQKPFRRITGETGQGESQETPSDEGA